MSGKSTRPALQVPDLTPPVRPAPRPVSPDDPRFRTAAAMESPEALARNIESGAVRVLNPDTAPSRVQADPPPLPRRPPDVSLSTKVPGYVMEQLRRRYGETGVTIRGQILIALQRDGLEILDEDTREDRRRARGS